ncbi:MAG TPA: cation:proton antiporter [Fibrobacteraceae bacterium]|nr:cation:proton antiporter [Fibrobacteraceae bacterium]
MGSLDAFTGEILVFLGSLVIAAYGLDILAKQSRVPGIILVLGLGMAARSIVDSTTLSAPPVEPFLPVLGTIGLILIVLEGAIELRIVRDRLNLILRAFLSALTILLATLFTVGGFLHLVVGSAWQIALLNATPLAVISSAVAIPSVGRLSEDKREFVTYESSFSDILGVLVFTKLSTEGNGPLSIGGVLAGLGGSLLATVLIAIVLSLGLFAMLIGIRNHVKSLLVLAVLLMAYGAAKILHLPALLIVFLFGLLLANPRTVVDALHARRFIPAGRIRMEVRLFEIVTGEMTFLVRAFFFFAFGFSINLDRLMNLKVILIAFGIYLLILIVRLAYLSLFARRHLFPEVFVAPRGLITILLFYSIPTTMLIPVISRDVLFSVVLLSSIAMAVALRVEPKSQPAPSLPPTTPSPPNATEPPTG